MTGSITVASPTTAAAYAALSEDHMINATRRSGRAKKAPAKYDDEFIPTTAISREPLGSMPRKRLPIKRKVAPTAVARPVFKDPCALLEEALAPLIAEERMQYRGWVELESEPAFFNAMLQDFGAKDLKVQEIFSLDEVEFNQLPKPVHGLVFLHQFISKKCESQDDRKNCPPELWFGNQTSNNSCGTVALMNIIMNTADAPGVNLGSELQEFKRSTQSLAPPHRGHALDRNDFIRSIHNSVARRLDLLSEDLLLQEKFQQAEKRKKLKKLPTKKKPPTGGSKKNKHDDAFHYIAYVPVKGQVWELDGMEAKPLCLGPYKADSWLKLASEAIQTRMLVDDVLSFNLLAVCQSPISTLSTQIRESMTASFALHRHFKDQDTWSEPEPLEPFTDDRLTELNLTRELITDEHSVTAYVTKANLSTMDLATAQNEAKKLRMERESLEVMYAAEVGEVKEAVEMVRGRQHDYTPAIHEWVRILSEKGVLRDLIKETNGQD